MPLYDFRCPSCDHRFEAQLPYGESPPCPACGHAEAERILSAFAGPFTVGLRGSAARRSDAKRSTREQQRAERKAARVEQRRQNSS
jgi:putative FmdB family regulatory protein